MDEVIGTTAYEHVGIRGSDRDAGIAFHSVLGFRLCEDFAEHADLEMENAAGVRIKLIYDGVARNNDILMDETVKHPDLTHPAFVVSSLDAGARRRICFIRDPDGNVIEFDEIR